jgi:hypothetical protein
MHVKQVESQEAQILAGISYLYSEGKQLELQELFNSNKYVGGAQETQSILVPSLQVRQDESQGMQILSGVSYLYCEGKQFKLQELFEGNKYVGEEQETQFVLVPPLQVKHDESQGRQILSGKSYLYCEEKQSILQELPPT